MNFKDKLRQLKNNDFLNKNKLLLILIILFSLLLIFLIIKGNEKPNKEVSDYSIYSDSSLITDENKLMMKTLLMSIANVDKIKTGHIDSQIKFLKKETEETETFNDLMSLTLSSNMSNYNNNVNLRGFVNLDMSSLDISLKFPLLANNLTSENYELYLDVASSYKQSFNMKEDIDYLYTNKDSIIYINETYGNLNIGNIGNETPILKSPEEILDVEVSNRDKFFNLTEGLKTNQHLENISLQKQDDKNCLFSFNFDSDDIIIMMNSIKEDELFKNSFILNNILPNILMDSENIDNIVSVNGQVAVNNSVATDIYFEIEKANGTIIAFRMLFTNINSSDIVVDEFKSTEVKNLSEFIDEINSSKEGTIVQTDKKITIGDVYFTGADETTKLEEFSKETLPSIINVFINFTDCSKQTILVVKWFYEDQEIPIIETKISNGDYEKGMLKTSISFVDSNTVQTGKYTLKVFIEGQENCVFEDFFEIK